jgi:hypothetical protein
MRRKEVEVPSTWLAQKSFTQFAIKESKKMGWPLEGTLD